MAGQKYTLKFITDLDLSNMKQGLNQFQDQLNKLGVPKSLSKSLNSTIESLKSEMKSIESLTSKEFISKSDMNSLISSYDKIDKLIRKINVDSKELNNLSLDKLLPTEQLNRFNKLESTLKKLQPLLNLKATIPEEIERLGDKAKTSQSNIEKLNKELKELEDKRSRNIEDQTNARTRTQELKTRKSTLEKEQEKLRSKPRGIQSEEYISLQKRIKEARTQITLLEQDLQKKEAQLKKVESTRTKNSEVKKANVEIAESNVAKAETKLNAEREKLQEMEHRARSLRAQKTDGTQLKVYKDNEEALKKLNKEIEDSEGKEKELSEKNKETAAAIVDKTSEIKKEQKELEKTNEKIKQLQEGGNVDQSKIDEIKKDIEELTGIKVETNNLEELKEILDNLKSDTIKQTSEDLDQFNEIQSEVERKAEEVSDSLNEETKAWEIFDNKQKEVDGIKARIASFFALDNAIQLVKRTMRSAYETIKELDKAMTETAVVTGFSVGDMWAQLPDYTRRANELGVTTKAAYEAATLYYQQGLKTNEVMAMSNETLKMARIAGLDAAVATDRKLKSYAA